MTETPDPDPLSPAHPIPARRICGGTAARILCAAVLLLAALPWARAGITDAPGEQLQVSLLTYGPGDIYWERFGHDAIEIRDRDSGESVAFNYGMFDFNQKNFLLNFARGHMRYRMDAVRTPDDLAYYRSEGRSIRRQQLALSPAQRANLRDFLLWNLQAANTQYNYNYYTANCATKVRDALDRVLKGALHKQLSDRPARLTWRQQTDRLMAAQPWLMLLLDLGLSSYADRPLDAWQDSFLPGVLARELASVQIANQNHDPQPLVTSDAVLARTRLTPPPAEPPDLRMPLLAAGAAFALVLLLAAQSRQRIARRVFSLMASLWLLVAGLAGLLMLLLWTLTEHESAWANANLLLFNPLAWLMLAAVWRKRPSRRDHLLSWLLVLLPAIGLLANLGGLLQQRNLPWILLALPIWLVLAHVIRTRAERTTAPAS
ncbi:MAG: DUF4105 domain-containing protein [Rhodanobacteraceae bacterium]